jgi:hypothetical protein
MSRLWPIFLAASSLVFPGCMTFRPANSVTATAPSEIVSAENERSEGYALLYELLVKERKVNKVLIVKKHSPELKVIIQKISDKSKRIAAELGPLARKNPPLNLKFTNLPIIEQKARELIEKETGKGLLKAKGTEFEFKLLESQLEGLNYGAHLAETLIAGETDLQRKDFLQRTHRTLAELRDEVYEMILRGFAR